MKKLQDHLKHVKEELRDLIITAHGGFFVAFSRAINATFYVLKLKCLREVN
jgi:hypothetical protein